MKLEIDTNVDAAYVWFQEVEVATTKALDSQRIVDYNEHGDIVGIEFLAVHRGVDLFRPPSPSPASQAFRRAGHSRLRLRYSS